MYDLERQNMIIEILKKSKSISVARLSELLYVSQPTVRRDLTALEEQGAITRTHGGAVLRNTDNREIPLMLRESQNNNAKKIIAEKAAKLIGNGKVIFMDASSTVSYLVPYLEKFDDLIVVTNSPKTSMKLGEVGIKNYCTGGLLLMHSVAYVGSETEKFISCINADLFFFSSRGYTEGGMITDSSPEEASVRLAMIKNSRECYYLADSSKKGKQYMYNICHTNDVDGIIED
ncbi:MAG: DeoR/GlpR transcriptional regulator [Ruminococcaceae bacterium]|nr:DeoR/GlpR transcriptional regulator [Oscillospiraceae bacterium]